MPNQAIRCPRCISENIMFSKKRNLHVCEECGEEFNPKKEIVSQHIFLSYGHDEQTSLAIRLRDDLQSRGHFVWFDEERLIPGYDWEDFIEKGIDDLSANKSNSSVVLMLTPHSIRRPDGYCLNEVARALSRGLRIIPIMVVESEPPLSICRIQWLDMRECIPINEKEAIYRPRYERLLAAIEEGKLDFEGTQQRLLKTLKPLAFDADILQNVQKFSGRQWVFNAIQDWLNDPKQRVFWICGDPGTGKSSISAFLSSRYLEVAALHLCKFGHAQKGDPRQVVTSIVYQLSTQLHDFEAILATMDIERMVEDDTLTLFDNLLVQPLAKLNSPKHAIIILIDALDEATSDGYNALAKFIAEEFTKTPSWLRLIITSRPEDAVTGPLSNYIPFLLETETDANRADIREYLRHELAPLLKVGVESAQIIERILDHSQGVFLYIEWVCRDLLNGNLSLDRLDELPKGMAGVFRGFFDRLIWNDKSKKPHPEYQRYRKDFRPPLRVILAAQQLPIKILQHLFNWKKDELHDFIRSLGSLFIITKEMGEEVIIPYHKSLIDWLINESKSGPYFVSKTEGHAELARLGINLFISNTLDSTPYMQLYLPVHIEASGNWESLINEGLSTLSSQASAEIIFKLAEFCRKSSRITLARKMHERSYVIRKKYFGEKHPATASSLHEIGECFHDAYEYKSAETYYLRAIDILEECSPTDQNVLANCLNDLGALYYEKSDSALALSLYFRALDLFISIHGEAHEDTVSAKHNIALIQGDLKNHSEAKRLATEAVEFFRKNPDKYYSKLDRAISSLIGIFNAASDKSQTLDLQAELLLLRSSRNTETSLHLVTDLVHLVLNFQSPVKEATKNQLLKRAMLLLLSAAKHPDREVVKLATNISLFLVNERMYFEGIPFARFAVNQSERVYGPSSLQTADALNSLVRCLQEINDDISAIPFARKSLENYCIAFKSDDPKLSAFLNNLGLSLFKSNQLPEAKEKLEQAVKCDPRSSYPHYWLAKLYQKQNHYELEKSEWYTYIELGPTSNEREEEAKERIQKLVKMN